MPNIRAATPDDNEALLALVKAGTGGLIDRTPDFFTRGKLYPDTRTYVAEEEGEIVGAVSRAVRSVVIAGREVPASYLFDLDYHKPYYDEALLSRCRQDDADAGVELSLIQLLTGNPRAGSRFAALGYGEAARTWMSVLTPVPGGDAPVSPDVRPATPADYPAMAALLNDCYRGHDFYVPFTADELTAMVGRLPGFAAADLLVREAGGDLQAVLGCLDYRAVYRFYNYARGRRPGQVGGGPQYQLPWLPQIDTPWHCIIPFPLGYRETVENLKPLWREYTRRLSARQAMGLLRFDQADPLRGLAETGAMAMTTSPMYLLAKAYGEYHLPRPERFVYADPRDL